MAKKKLERDGQMALLEAFLSLAGLDLISIKEATAFARQIKGLSWKVRGEKLKLIVDGVEVEDLELNRSRAKSFRQGKGFRKGFDYL